MTTTTTPIQIPTELRPADGRFGSGPSKVRQEAVDRLRDVAPGLLGTSHRRPPVLQQVRRVREGLVTFFRPPDGYEIALGNGGASLFWDIAVHHLIEHRSAHAVFGEFSSKFTGMVSAAPFLADPVRIEAEPGTHPEVTAQDGVDAYALTHCETSTGVAMPISRPAPEGLVLVDATSAAGGLSVDLTQADAYYFSPQKCFASDGGLWVALLSPAAVERAQRLTAQRYVPALLDLPAALAATRKDQTINTPAIATLFLMGEQLDWMNARGGLAWAVEDCARKAAHLYDWAARSDYATPFVADPSQRSNVVCTIDFADEVAADEVTGALRANGIVDIEAYRKLGRNQVRVAVFPAVDLADVERLTAAIDYVVAHMRG